MQCFVVNSCTACLLCNEGIQLVPQDLITSIQVKLLGSKMQNSSDVAIIYFSSLFI
jgi:hypothetical protein